MGIWVCDKDSISYEPYYQYKIISNIILAQNIFNNYAMIRFQNICSLINCWNSNFVIQYYSDLLFTLNELSVFYCNTFVIL